MTHNGPKKKVAIVGGGYGGLKALAELAHRNDVEIILIDMHPYHYLQTDIYDFIANKTNITDVTISLVTLSQYYCGKVIFMQQKVCGFDFANNTIHTESGTNISYDYLILAVGSRTFFPHQIEGLAEHAHGVKSLKNAFRFKQEFEKEIHKKVEEEGLCSVDDPDFNIIVGGGGLSGVEIAAAMSEYSQSFFKHSGYACGGVSVYLIEGAPHIMNGLDPYLVKKTEGKLTELGVKIITNAKVQKVTENSVELSDGRKIGMNFMIWTGGVKASPVLELVELEKNSRNHVVVDEFLRPKGLMNVFAIGDCAQITSQEGEVFPQIAQVAEISGVLAAKNIILLMDGHQPKHTTAEIKPKGILVALGGTYCAAYLLDKLRFSGYLAYLVKHAVSVAYKEPLVVKCRSGLKKCDVK
jgi:NADH:ubiquinone reductase (H+-translocating)